jgi:hypothetical protein
LVDPEPRSDRSDVDAARWLGARALPEENLGWRKPADPDRFIRRDLRWCQGNMQYWRFLTWPGLRFVSRYRLAAI